MGKYQSKSSSKNPVNRVREAPVYIAPTSLGDALFTRTQQRVLRLLFGQPSRSFFASELIALAGSGSGTVQRELKRLTSSGLVTAKLIGRQKHYQANPACPVFTELSGLILKTVGVIEPVRLALQPIKERIKLALVYGSVAKRTDTSSSDIDLLIVANDLALVTVYSVLMPAEESVSRTINPTLYTTEEFDRRRKAENSFLVRVLGGEHVVLIGKIDDAA